MYGTPIEEMESKVFNVLRVTWGKSVYQIAKQLNVKVTNTLYSALTSLLVQGLASPDENNLWRLKKGARG
jgi:hypothetical protein